MPTLTDRDLAILHSVGTARMLTNREIEWLHFPGWEAREDAQAQANPRGTYNPSSSVRTRLGHLSEAGYLSVIPRVMHLRRQKIRKLPMLYALTSLGRVALIEEQLVADDAPVWVISPQTRSVANIEHAAEIGRCYAALRAAAHSDQQQMDDWRGDLLLSQSYDRVAVVGFQYHLPVLPDATMRLTSGTLTRRFFLEVDRGTMGAYRWREKIAAFEAYRGSEAYRARFGNDEWFTLIVAPTERRVMEIARMVARTVREPSYTYLFATLDQLHPRSIRRCWQRISAVAWKPRRTVRGVSEEPIVTLHPVGLWRALTHPSDTSPDIEKQTHMSGGV